MSRRKISEYRSKKIIHRALKLPYVGWGIEAGDLEQDLGSIGGHSSYVVKVDQAVKGRYKKGLVTLDAPKTKLGAIVARYLKQGYGHFIVEPYIQHKNVHERYLSLTHDRDGVLLSISSRGGIDIENQSETIISYKVDDRTNWREVAEQSGLTYEQLRSLTDAFVDNHFVFLEINPYVVDTSGLHILDTAVEVDDAATFLVHEWTDSDIRYAQNLSKEEKIVRELDEGSIASFNLSVINPQGSIFLLLSGGGASIVVADDIYSRGYGGQLANYGEYSGNPSLHETVKYTSQVLELLLASNAPRKVLFIGGAVANFTDIAVTFAGIIEAIDTYANKLSKHNIKVYVRRGGPNQEEGLENMRSALERHGLLGAVYDATVPITKAVGEALEGLKK